LENVLHLENYISLEDSIFFEMTFEGNIWMFVRGSKFVFLNVNCRRLEDYRIFGFSLQ